jgi:sensor histidine kinase YesM
LQILAENAIKHNEFSLDRPLLIDVFMNEESIVVENIVRKKPAARPSSKIGLQNLAERYKLITERTISISEFGNKFSVVLPVLKLEL